MYYFILEIYLAKKDDKGDIKKDDKGDIIYESIPLSLSSEEKSSVTLTFDTTNVSATLVSLTYNKRVSHPCEITAVLQMDYKSGITTSKALKETFINARIKLKKTNSTSKEYDIAENYYIHKIEPKYAGTVSMYVTMHIYSDDNKLTINKFCKAYTGKKLVENILLGYTDKEESKKTKALAEAIQKYGIRLANDIEDADKRCTFLRFLSYSVSIGGNGSTSKTIREFRHPYLVQYNESLYEFIARTANRCGEYVFFENGMLYVGLPDSFTKSPLEIKKYASLTYGSSFEEEKVTVQSHSHNGMNPKGVSYLEKGENAYVFATPQDEYFTSYEEDQWDSFEKEYLTNWTTKIFSWVSTILANKSRIRTFISEIGISEVAAAIEATNKAKETNQKKNKSYITDMPSDQQYVIKNKKMASPFNSVRDTVGSGEETNDFRKNLYSLFYSTIYAGEKYVTQNQIYIDIEDEYVDVTLGNAISVEGETYIVTEIYGSFANENGAYHEKYRIVAVPNFPDPASNNSYIVLPPLYQGGHVRISSPQIACIANTGDPESHGRVRIRYPWQSKEDDASPWIRMASPFAVEGGGMYFEPDKGTEVLVDYVNGNVEHPYVVGQLYSGNFTTPSGKRVISSANGQSITMKDASDVSDFVNNLWGGRGFLTKFIPSFGESFKDIAGEMKMSDRYEIYSIKMSSTERKISIKSNFGDVSIGAFTGISISAPNGDISITGKNVKITAGNTLTLKSGENIHQKETPCAKRIETISVDILKKVGAHFDLGLLRSILEALIKPTAGTLQLKSYRYMTLEAGKGKAKLPRQAYTVKGIKQGVKDEKNADLLNNVRLISQVVEKWDDECRTAYKAVVDNIHSLFNALDSHTSPSGGSNNSWAANSDSLKEKIYALVDKVRKNPEKKISINKNSIEEKFSAKFKNENEEDIEPVINAAKTLCESVQAYVQKVNEPGKVGLFKHIGDKRLNEAINKIGMKMDFYSDVASGTKKFEEQCPIKAVMKNDLKVFKRKLAKQYIEVENLKITPKKEIKETDIPNDAKWAEYIGGIINKGEEPVSFVNRSKKFGKDLVSQFKEDGVDALALPGFFASQGVWGLEKHGEILFSDKAGYTVNFENGHLYQTRNDDIYFITIIDTLKSL